MSYILSFLFFCQFTHSPEESPFSIVLWLLFSVWLISFSIRFLNIFMLFGQFFELWSSPNLIGCFREDISHLSLVVVLRPGIEELLHHVEELLVLLRLDSGIFNNEAAIILESFDNSLTFSSRILVVQEWLNINDWD